MRSDLFFKHTSGMTNHKKNESTHRVKKTQKQARIHALSASYSTTAVSNIASIIDENGP